MAKKESNFYDEMQKISEGLCERKTLTPQLLREHELSQYGISSNSGFSQFINEQKKEDNEMEELERKIKELTKKIEKLNKFSEHMHFMDDQEIVEMYEVIHKEEMKLKNLVKKYELLKAERENLKEI